jgi:hypothetical protein
MLLTLRGVSRIAASAAGLWLIYGGTYPTEDMTTRIPTNPLHELWVTTLWMVPWMLLFCSGVEDFEKIAGRAWIFGVFLPPALFFLSAITQKRSFLNIRRTLFLPRPRQDHGFAPANRGTSPGEVIRGQP